MKNRNNKKGFALLFAVLTAALMLTIGVSIFNISLKELLISGAARDSQIAFYAADSARECALYWDLKKAAFRTCVGDDCVTDTSNVSYGLDSFTCAGKTTPLNDYGFSNNTFTFFSEDAIKYSDSPFSPDASLRVIKQYDSSRQKIITTISSQGHNTGPENRRVERGIIQVFDPDN